MIFAAGLGTRLRPLTNHCPKALVEVGGKPLLQHCIEKLKTAGVEIIIVNVHHFADKVENFLARHNYFDMLIEISDEREFLLDTGGGLKKAAQFFNDGQAFLLHNVDVLSNIDLLDFYNFHLQSGAMVSLACNRRESSRYFLFDSAYRLCGWENVKTAEQKIVVPMQETFLRLAFGGIHIINPAIFKLMPATTKFSIVDFYLQIATEQLINAYVNDSLQFLDVGKPAQLAEADLKFREIKTINM